MKSGRWGPNDGFPDFRNPDDIAGRQGVIGPEA